MSDKETSTLQSYVDSAAATAQSALGSVTGSNADKQQAENKQREAEAKDTLSHTGGTVGGMSVSSSGVAANDQNRQAGSWNQTIGSSKEALGGLIGNQNLKQAGAEQNEQGKAQEAQGQLSDLGKGASDRVQGALGGAVAGLTGDREKQEEANRQHDMGKTLQRGVEGDLQKQAPQ